MKLKLTTLLVLLLSILFLTACGSKKLKPNLPIEERMKLAIEMFEKEDYYDAKTQFRIVTLSYSGHAMADKAQFYLAECHFYEKEYILSASEYERLIKVFPNSEYVDDAKYKLGKSYSMLAPNPALDQEYTEKAIKEYQEFLEDYYFSPLVETVEKELATAKNKMAKKLYDAATQYRKMSQSQAAIIYYNKVLEGYYESDYAPLSQYWIGECHKRLKEYTNARDAYNSFIEKYPKHDLISKARERLEDIQDEIAKQEKESDKGDTNT